MLDTAYYILHTEYMPKKESFDFKTSFERLEKINEWFARDDINLDEALEKYKEGVEIVKETKKHLKDAENEFKEIQKTLSDESE